MIQPKSTSQPTAKKRTTAHARLKPITPGSEKRRRIRGIQRNATTSAITPSAHNHPTLVVE
jgi:hypothetical protein